MKGRAFLLYDTPMNFEVFPWTWILGAGFLVMFAALLMSLRKKHPGGEDAALPELVRRISQRLDLLEEMGAKIQGLDQAFRAPRVRGGWGEGLLEELLGSWLPRGSWTAQYSFPDGTRVDAVIRMGDRLVAIDAKFPLERLGNWLESEGREVPGEVRRVFTGYAEDIARKYIKPQAGTLSFALLYLPAEGIHYRLLQEAAVIQECLRLGVLPVGPSSLFVYLQTVSYGLKGLALPAEGREWQRRVEQLRRDFQDLLKPLATAGTHLKNLNKSWEEIDRKRNRVEGSLEGLDRQPPGAS